MHVQAILDSKGHSVITIRSGETVAAAVRQLVENRIGALIVLDEADNVVGIISERDIVGGLYEAGGSVESRQVSELMTRDVVVCTPADTIETIMNGMTERRVRHLPVMEEARLIGIVSIGDVVKHRLQLSEMEVSSLRQYVMEAR